MKSEKQFINAYDEYSEAILRHISFRVNRREKAEDIAQDTFLKAWKYIVSAEKKVVIKNMKAFLYTIANNLVIDHYRQKYKQTISIDDVEEKEFRMESDQEKNAERSINKEIVEEHLSELKEEYRDMLVYRYIDDLSIKEIEEITGKSSNNIRVILHRAIKKLQQSMNHVQEI